MDEIAERAKIAKEAASARRRERYALARELGFTPTECTLLAVRAEKYIRDLAETRAKEGG